MIDLGGEYLSLASGLKGFPAQRILIVRGYVWFSAGARAPMPHRIPFLVMANLLFVSSKKDTPELH